MGLTHASLAIIKYIQEQTAMPIQTIAERFKMSSVSIRRTIEGANLFLPHNKAILIKNGVAHTQMDYFEYTDFVKSIRIQDYSPTIHERLAVLSVTAFFAGYVNLSALYERWNMSMTTKKSDTHQLRKLLESYFLEVEVLRKKGIRIIGDELRYRLFIIQIILPLIEIKGQYRVVGREANSPFEAMIFDLYSRYCLHETAPKTKQLVAEFLREYKSSLTYASKKFVVLYISMSLFRMKENRIASIQALRLTPLNLYLFNERNENRAFNHIAAMIDFNPSMEFPHNDMLLKLTIDFVDSIQKHIITPLNTKEAIIKELYLYFYKQFFINHYKYEFKDNLIRNTEKQLPNLYQNVIRYSDAIQQSLAITLTAEQFSSITLILRKWINKNKIYGRNLKRIIIVTNVSFERMSYFIESLKEWVEFHLAAVLDIDEISSLGRYDFECIISFSNRIISVLSQHGYTALKLNFFLDHNDHKKLLDQGFSTSKRRFLARQLAEELANCDEATIDAFLKEKYSDYFI